MLLEKKHEHQGCSGGPEIPKNKHILKTTTSGNVQTGKVQND